MKTVSVWIVGLLSLGAAVGCANSSNAPARASSLVGPHGGFAATLPGDVGVGEVVIERSVVAPGKDPDVQVVVYFLTSDFTSPLNPLPTDVSVKLQFPDKEPETLTLHPEPRADDPAGAGRFASQPGSYLVDEPIGEITAMLAGRSCTVPFTSIR